MGNWSEIVEHVHLVHVYNGKGVQLNAKTHSLLTAQNPRTVRPELSSEEMFSPDTCA